MYCKMFDGEKNFIIMLLYLVDIFVARSNKKQIQDLKAQVAREFHMKEFRQTNKTAGLQIYHDKKY